MTPNTYTGFGDPNWVPLGARAAFQPPDLAVELTAEDYEFLAAADEVAE